MVEAVEMYDAERGGHWFEERARQQIRHAILVARGGIQPSRSWARAIDEVLEDPGIAQPPRSAAPWPLRSDLSSGELSARLLDHLTAPDDSSGDPARIVEGRAERSELARSIARLPEKDLVVLALRYAEGLTIGEISSALDLPAKSVSQRLERTLRNLRSMLEDDR